MTSSASSRDIPPKRSLDGYIRLTFAAFLSLKFQRKLTWKDEELKRDLIIEDIPAFCAGYCEWATDGYFRVSLGWAWFGLAGGRKFVAPGGVSSNVMLVTRTGYDFGVQRTQELLRAWLSSENWQIEGVVCGL